MLTLLSMDICSCLINIVPLKKFSFGSSGHHVLSTVSSRLLRAILCMNQAKWEMKNLTPPPPLKFCMQLDIVGGCLKMHFVRVPTLLLSW